MTRLAPQLLPFRDADTRWQVVAVRYGTRETTRAECFAGYDAYGEPDGPLRMDYFFYVLRAGERSVLVDVGFDQAVGERRGRTSLWTPRAALAALGIDPLSIATILLTHLHYDHLGNLGDFPNAELVVHEEELAFWTGPRASEPEFAPHVETEEIAELGRARDAGRVRILHDDVSEVSSGIAALRVGGHSAGQLVLVVNGADGRAVVLASDAVHYYEELEHERPFAIYFDLDGMVASYEIVRQLAEENGAAVVAGHDPAVLERFPALPDGPAELGALVG
jgi:glyoxylase-like metal-dependent hydrolase (beta-lactamase superfamily II)